MTISATLTVTALDIVIKAYKVLGAIDKNLSLSAKRRETGFENLNFLVKSLQTSYHQWTETQAVIPLAKDQIEYNLGVGGDHAADKSDWRQYLTTGSSAGTTLNVTGNIIAGDNIGIIHFDATIQWTTVVSYAAGVATLTDALTGTANTGSTVYVYTNLLDRPVRVVNSRHQTVYTADDTPTSKWNATQYYETESKTTQGSVQAWYYSPQLTQGVLSIYKAPANNEALLNVTYVRPLNITTDNGDLIDFPSEWFLALSYMLAQIMLPEVSSPEQNVQEINILADKYAQMVGFAPLGKLKPQPEAGT